MKVLSLFDGISCGMAALERAGIQVEKYVAYEIEPNAIKVSLDNYPFIEQCGDVTNADFTQYKGFDIVIAGSPCQGFSKAGKQLNFNDPRSKLFFEFVRALEEVKPKYFLLENVAMKKEYEDTITEILGVKPIKIDSSLVSGAMRSRNYWTNIPNVEQPPDRHITYQSILDSGIAEKEKAYCLKLCRGNARDYFKKHQTNIVFEPCENGEYTIKNEKIEIIFKKSPDKKPYVFDVCIPDGKYNIRPTNRNETERLQTLPDNYTKAVSEAQANDLIGNGWTVDVIAHIFKYLKREENKQMELKMNEYQLPEQILFNYEELKQELTEKVSMYETLVYTDEQIKEAKADRANLNKLKKALNDERIRREKEYMEPFNDFKAKINEIIGIIDKPVAVIDKQVKEYEEKQKQEKKEAILEMWNAMEHPEALTFEKVFMDRFLNTSTSMKVVEQCLADSITKYNNDLATLSNLPEFGFEATEVYKSTLDINKAISEAKRMSEIAKAKAEREAAEKARAEEQARLEAEKKAAEMVVVGTVTVEANVDGQEVPVAEVPVEVPAKMWVAFKALLSTDDAVALKEFFEKRNIQFESI